MINLAGADEDEIQIVVSGMRPGEKLHEELFTEEEQLNATTESNLMIAHHEPSIDEDGRFYIDMLIAAAERRDWAEIDRCIKILDPAYAEGVPAGS